MALKYTGFKLDRCSAQRQDRDWLNQQFEQSNACFIAVDKDELWFNLQQPLELEYFSKQDLGDIKCNQVVLLGLDTAKQQPFFAFSAEHLTDQLRARLSKRCQPINLRKQGPLLDNELAAMCALAKGLIHWHVTHRFCGRCGTVNTSIQGGHCLKCDNGNCNHLTFPRTDPAVIMLVQKTFSDGITRCLLGRQASWPEGVYSTLAGFVDPGESLEEAVIREVKEESGVEVESTRYVASQPWLFPSSLMLGFYATARSEYIETEQDELEQAKWFSALEVSQFNDWHSAKPGYKTPRCDSISYYLIDNWLRQQLKS